MAAASPLTEQTGRIIILGQEDIQIPHWPPTIPTDVLNLENSVPAKIYTKAEHLFQLVLHKNFAIIDWTTGQAEYLLTDFAYSKTFQQHELFWLLLRDQLGNDQVQCFACKLLSRAGSG